MTYYRILTDDLQYPDRWFLGEPLTKEGLELDAREFRYGRSYGGPAPACVPIDYEGHRVSFNLGAFDMPVVTTQIAEILERLSGHDIERFPIVIDKDVDGYEILNVVSTRQCLDETRSGVRKWQPEDGRPDKVGQYREIAQLVIDPSRVGGSHLFRIWSSLVRLIVSEEAKEALVGLPDLGVVFERCLETPR